MWVWCLFIVYFWERLVYTPKTTCNMKKHGSTKLSVKLGTRGIIMLITYIVRAKWANLNYVMIYLTIIAGLSK
jgi:hypothetical protein